MKLHGMGKDSRQGFTLIELLVVTAVSGLLLGAITYLFMTHQQVYTVQDQVHCVFGALRLQR